MTALNEAHIEDHIGHAVVFLVCLAAENFRVIFGLVLCLQPMTFI